MAAVLRGIASVVTVLLAIAVSDAQGDNAGKIATALIGSLFIVLIEWFVRWSPEHLRWARALFDPRARWTGLWVQEVTLVTDSKGLHPHDDNACSVFSVDYAQDSGYGVDGVAYDPHGVAVARYQSQGFSAFTKDGRTMSYVWTGDVLRPRRGLASTHRTGLASLRLKSDRRTGEGRVQHVGLNREFLVSITRVDEKYLAANGLNFTLKSLHDDQTRLLFGPKAARALASNLANGQRSQPGKWRSRLTRPER